MKRVYKAPALILIVIFLSGCWDQNVFEKIGFIITQGMDLGTENNTLVTFALPIISQGESSNGSSGGQGNEVETKTEVNDTEAYLAREARDIGRQASHKQLEGGKIQNFIFGKEFAQERSISTYFEVFERDTQGTVQAWVAIVDGSANELITKGSKLKGKPRIGFYLNDLLERNYISGYCPEINIIKYNIINNKIGISPIIPMIKLEEDSVRVIGTALIDRDKMTGQLDTKETSILFLAMGKTKKSEITFELPKEIKTIKKIGIFFPRKVKSKINISYQNNVPELYFNISLNVRIDEYTWGNLPDPAYKKMMENRINDSVKAELTEVFKKLQEAKCDPMGIGNKIRAFNHNYWKSIDEQDGWKEIYPQITANFNVKTDIVRYGEIK